MRPYRDAPPPEPESPPPRRPLLPTIGDAAAFVVWSLVVVVIVTAMFGKLALWLGLVAWCVVASIYLTVARPT